MARKIVAGLIIVGLVVTLCIPGVVATLSGLAGQGIAWAQLGHPWTIGAGGGFLYPTLNEHAITGGTTLATADIFLGNDGSAVFNEQGLDSDFRVEGDTVDDLLFVDAGNDRVAIGTDSPAVFFQVTLSGSTETWPTETVQLLQNSGSANDNVDLVLTSGTNGHASLVFGDPGAISAGQVFYDNALDLLELKSTGDIALAADLTYTLGGQRVDRTPIDDTDSPYSVALDNYYIGVDSTEDPVVLNLPAAATAGAGRVYIIKDEAGETNNNSITIDPSGTETIDGIASSIVWNSVADNFSSITIICDGSNWFKIAQI
ncbi:hypothetical protein IIA79_02150 [bacterium]|nr:hypothetical protein [bacterium]